MSNLSIIILLSVALITMLIFYYLMKKRADTNETLINSKTAALESRGLKIDQLNKQLKEKDDVIHLTTKRLEFIENREQQILTLFKEHLLSWERDIIRTVFNKDGKSPSSLKLCPNTKEKRGYYITHVIKTSDTFPNSRLPFGIPTSIINRIGLKAREVKLNEVITMLIDDKNLSINNAIVDRSKNI